MNGGGSNFLEQYFASLELFVKEYPKHHALFKRPLSSLVRAIINSILVSCGREVVYIGKANDLGFHPLF